MTWTFVWLMVGLKIPIAALIYIVWWAVKDPPDPVPAPDEGGGGGNDRVAQHRHPRKPLPRRPRRGPHGGLAATPPARIRTARARTRTFEH